MACPPDMAPKDYARLCQLYNHIKQSNDPPVNETATEHIEHYIRRTKARRLRDHADVRKEVAWLNALRKSGPELATMLQGLQTPLDFGTFITFMKTRVDDIDFTVFKADTGQYHVSSKRSAALSGERGSAALPRL